MANGNHKEKLAIVCIGIVLLLTILGIVVLIGTGNGKKPDSQDRLQEEILEYAEDEKNTEEEAQRIEDRQQIEEGTAGQTEVLKMEPVKAAEQAGLDLKRILSEMKGYWEAGNMEAVEDLAHLSRYLEASKLLAGTTRFYYMGGTDDTGQPQGKGLAIYADNQYYYGDWEAGSRSGSGM